MNSLTALAALLGAGTGLGLVLLAAAPAPARDAGQAEVTTLGPIGRWRAGRRGPRDGRRIVACVAAGVAVGLMTRWPVAAILAATGTWILPALIGPDRDHARRVARIEAIATWTESLRDTLSAAAGLEQAIVATAPMSPAPIRAEVTRLADRISHDQRLPGALRRFAVEVDDPTADLVVAALVMAAERHARHLADLLDALAGAARDQASLRMRVAAGRARVRTSIRVITGVTLAMAAGLVILNRGYLNPYDTATGQLVLALVGGLFGIGFWWLARIATPKQPARVVSLTAESGTEVSS